jgi:Mitochondrial carrier protein
LARNNPIPAYKGVIDAIIKMYKWEGFSTLYRGVMLNICAGSVANCIFFYIYTDGKIRYNYDPERPCSLKAILIAFRASLIG